MSQKVSTKTPKTGTQMPLINIDAQQAMTPKVQPAKAPKVKGSASVAPKVKGSAATLSAKPAKPKAKQKTKLEQATKVERPIFKPGKRIFYLRERNKENPKQKGRPFGCVAYEFAKVNDNTYSFRCGLSLLNKNYDNWDRVKAREIAVGRCDLNPTISFVFTEHKAKQELQSLKEKFVSSSNYEVLFTLQELLRFHPMTKVTKAIDAKLAEYALLKNDGT